MSVLGEIQLAESYCFETRNSSLRVWKQSLSERYTLIKYFMKSLDKALENNYCSVTKGNNSSKGLEGCWVRCESCNLSLQEVESGESEVQGYPRYIVSLRPACNTRDPKERDWIRKDG